MYGSHLATVNVEISGFFASETISRVKIFVLESQNMSRDSSHHVVLVHHGAAKVATKSGGCGEKTLSPATH